MGRVVSTNSCLVTVTREIVTSQNSSREDGWGYEGMEGEKMGP